MNKKGQMELADLAGFILIFITTIVLGIVFVNLSPKANIEIMDAEYGNYLAKYAMLDFLGNEENGKNMADLAVLSVKNNNFDYLHKKVREVFDKGANYVFVVYSDDKIVYFTTNVQSQEGNIAEFISPKYKYNYDVFNMNLENLYENKIRAELYLLKSAELEEAEAE